MNHLKFLDIARLPFYRARCFRRHQRTGETRFRFGFRRRRFQRRCPRLQRHSLRRATRRRFALARADARHAVERRFQGRPFQRDLSASFARDQFLLRHRIFSRPATADERRLPLPQRLDRREIFRRTPSRHGLDSRRRQRAGLRGRAMLRRRSVRAPRRRARQHQLSARHLQLLRASRIDRGIAATRLRQLRRA